MVLEAEQGLAGWFWGSHWPGMVSPPRFSSNSVRVQHQAGLADEPCGQMLPSVKRGGYPGRHTLLCFSVPHLASAS